MPMDTIPELKGLTLEPFARVRRCSKCGHGRYPFLPVWLMRLMDLPITSFDIGYCKGGYGLTRDVHILPGMHAEVDMICAGMSEEHIHVKCNECHHIFLMHTAETAA